MLRLDGGCGPEATLHWALGQGDHVLAKGSSGNRATACARAVPRWEERRPGERWMAPAPTPLHDDRRPQTAVLQGKTAPGKDGPSRLTTSWPQGSLRELAELDDERAAIDAECKADQGGLQLHRRRKPRLAAPEALVFLTDVAPTLLAWTRGWLFGHSPFADAGLSRMIKELFPIPGKSLVHAGRIVK